MSSMYRFKMDWEDARGDWPMRMVLLLVWGLSLALPAAFVVMVLVGIASLF